MPHLPVILEMLIVFALIVAATAWKVHLGLAAAVGGFVFALWRGLPLAVVAKAAAAEALSWDTVLLLVLMAGIMAFSTAMKKAGAMDAFSKALRAVAPSPRAAMGLAPLFIGTLPMPGGAILSAPLVDAMDPERKLGGDTLAAANYWFRHALELAWPLYPAFILTSSLSGLSVGRLMLLNLYALPLIFVLGLVFILPKRAGAEPSKASTKEPLATRISSFIKGIAPLAMVLGVYALVDALWRALSPALGLAAPVQALCTRYLPIYVGLAAGIVYLRLVVAPVGAFKGALSWATAKLLAVILGIRVFSALLTEAGAAQASAAELAAAGIPALLAVVLLPFVAGLVTGVGFGYVGLAFPIILGLLPAGGAFPREAGIVLAGVFGWAGMMLSPLHVCMVVSAEHFGSGLALTIKRFALPLCAFMAAGAAYAFVLSFFLA